MSAGVERAGTHRAVGLRPIARARSAAGFTLLEMLIAIALMAVVALVSWRGLDSAMRAREGLVANLARTRTLGRCFSQLQYDMANLVTPDEVFGPPLRIMPGELVLIRHIGVGSDEPTRLQVVRYRLHGGVLARSASEPVSTLSRLADTLQHMERFPSAAASDRVVSMSLAVWIPSLGWVSDQAEVAQSYQRFLATHGISSFTSIGMPLPKGLRFVVRLGSPALEYSRVIPIGQ
ncbi:prepilin-type N-terminal cleavage/methylation domain-containing protein [Trinickia caryophylli]|uniref:General secretion pathway protein J n=1 Tax=Trinickia caryophylli TaxID=28094 RepID=A0A1X7DP84_TRICW|nr:prepilin-type N-terminal cleavage/methylation domain-containing protein [Trinickia caryophylli]PMS10599.1 prepilin-type N-terminal cleavage/methylation domain-containing protein [Trinickia caryophylli]TRX17227.1 prepilin-type N-terminal cleavage/methylation domain-containing protein [Trinickia caryophylli]WQE12039.1 prepilin-type N-terminal cleavage/methylation domain-containing protein [Trinickia caryophylli]SMF19035.1 general secretion pathway protein J [Trinickia caryophylli]GLU31840.1 h